MTFCCSLTRRKKLCISVPDSVSPFNSLQNLKICLDVSFFPVAARFKVRFHQQGGVPSLSKSEEKLPAVRVRAPLGPSWLWAGWGSGNACGRKGSRVLRPAQPVLWRSDRQLCQESVGSVPYSQYKCFFMSCSKTVMEVAGHKECFFLQKGSSPFSPFKKEEKTEKQLC